MRPRFAIICLILGILGFVKGHIAVTKQRELRGAPMYVVAALLCVPLPLSFLVGAVMGATHVAQGTPLDQKSVLIAGAVATWAPILLAIILGIALSKPKNPPIPPRAQGFEVKI